MTTLLVALALFPGLPGLAPVITGTHGHRGEMPPPAGTSKKTSVKAVPGTPKLVDRGDPGRSRVRVLPSRGYCLRVVVTAYSGRCPIQGTGSRTATGRSVDLPGCAVDPRVIPLGSVVEIDGVKKKADDTGGAIRGRRIDWRLASRGQALQFGRKRLTVRVYPPPH